MSVTRELLHHGEKCSVYFLKVAGRCPAEEFYDDLQPQDQFKGRVWFKRIADIGAPHNEQKFRRLQAPVALYEIKPTSQVRFLCFWDGPDVLIVTHGFFKKRATETRREIERALRLRTEYYEDRRSPR